MLSDVLDFIETVRSIYQNVLYFIRSKNYVLNFAAVTYSLHKCSETKLRYKLQLTVYVSPVFQRIGVHGSKNTCHRSDLNLLNVLLWRALYHQDFRDLDHLKHVLLH